MNTDKIATETPEEKEALDAIDINQKSLLERDLELAVNKLYSLGYERIGDEWVMIPTKRMIDEV